MPMFILHVHVNNACPWTWTISFDMDMQHEHGDKAWTWTCSMDMDMQHEDEFGHPACPCLCCMLHAHVQASCPFCGQPTAVKGVIFQLSYRQKCFFTLPGIYLI
jgi:hypothetical protein